MIIRFLDHENIGIDTIFVVFKQFALKL